MKRIILSLFIMVLSNRILAQQTGIVQYPKYGVEFTIPNGWVGQELEESYAMKSKQEKGLMLLTLTEVTSMSDLKSEFSKPITESGMLLNPIEELKVYNNYVARYYTGTIDGTKVKALSIGQLNSYRHSITMAVITEANAFLDTHKNALFSLKNSLKLQKPKVNESFNAAICKRDLVGNKLTYEKYNYSGGGVGGISGSNSVSREINLCESGLFTYYGGVNVNAGGESSHGYGHSTSEGDGKWQFVDRDEKVFLYLNYHNGEIRYYQVTYGEDGGTYLDNTRYYLVDSDCN